jgi:hypothetical protein
MALRAALVCSMAWLCTACPIPEPCPNGIGFTYQGCSEPRAIAPRPALRNAGAAPLEIDIVEPLVPYVLDCARLEREPQLASALSWRGRPDDHPEHVTLAPGAVHEVDGPGAGECGVLQLRTGDPSATRFVVVRWGVTTDLTAAAPTPSPAVLPPCAPALDVPSAPSWPSAGPLVLTADRVEQAAAAECHVLALTDDHGGASELPVCVPPAAFPFHTGDRLAFGTTPTSISLLRGTELGGTRLALHWSTPVNVGEVKLRLEPGSAVCSSEASGVRTVLAPSTLVIEPPRGAAVRLGAGGHAEVPTELMTYLFALAHAYQPIAVPAAGSSERAPLIDRIGLVVVERDKPH